MRSLMVLTAAALWLAPLWGPASASGSELSADSPRPVATQPPRPLPPTPPATQDDSGCGKYGTTIDFLDTPTQAAKQARREQKLVMVLHLSGIFEDKNLT